MSRDGRLGEEGTSRCRDAMLGSFLLLASEFSQSRGEWGFCPIFQMTPLGLSAANELTRDHSALSLVNSVTLACLPNISMPQFPHLQKGAKLSPYLVGVLRRCTEILHVKGLACAQ